MPFTVQIGMHFAILLPCNWAWRLEPYCTCGQWQRQRRLCEYNGNIRSYLWGSRRWGRRRFPRSRRPSCRYLKDHFSSTDPDQRSRSIQHTGWPFTMASCQAQLHASASQFVQLTVHTLSVHQFIFLIDMRWHFRCLVLNVSAGVKEKRYLPIFSTKEW